MSDRLREALKLAVSHIEHMAAWIGEQRRGYSFESLGEDMPGIKAALRASTDAAPVADWIGPVPCDGRKPDWLPDNALCMIAYNPLESQNAMTWEFAEKRAKPARDRDWDGATAFCFKPLAHPPVPDAAPVAGEDVSLVKARRIVDTVTEFCRGSDFSCDMKTATKAILPLLKALSDPPATDTAQAEPVGLREIVERFCDWVARADDETDDCDYLNGYHPDQMIDERDGWDDLRDIRDSALAVLSTPPARTDEMRQLIDAAKAILADIADHPNAQRHLSGTKIMALGDAIAALSKEPKQ